MKNPKPKRRQRPPRPFYGGGAAAELAMLTYTIEQAYKDLTTGKTQPTRENIAAIDALNRRYRAITKG